jgi:uncharacterized membrane protein
MSMNNDRDELQEMQEWIGRAWYAVWMFLGAVAVAPLFPPLGILLLIAGAVWFFVCRGAIKECERHNDERYSFRQRRDEVRQSAKDRL